MRFADLFAGLGGFHLALRRLGHTCVFACEVDEALRVAYEKNFEMKSAHDIREVDVAKIPAHEILCAGFPCQPDRLLTIVCLANYLLLTETVPLSLAFPVAKWTPLEKLTISGSFCWAAT